MIRIPSWAEPRVTAVLLAAPFVAGAIVGVIGKKLLLWVSAGTVLGPGDQSIGLPLGAISLIALIALFVRAKQVWRGATSRFRFAFRASPFIALAGTVLGLAANYGR